MSPESTTLEPVKVVYCYSRLDADSLGELERYLAVFKQNGLLETWYDDKTDSGDVWTEQIKEQFNAAEIFLLLVSQNFLASDFIHREEFPLIMERRNQRNVRVIPVILRESPWQELPQLERLQAVPKDGAPIESSKSVATAFTGAARRIAAAARTVAAARRIQTPPTNKLGVADQRTRVAIRSLPRRNQSFSGRKQLLETLRDRLDRRERQPAAIPLFGLDGMGKTSVALEYAHRFAHEYSLVWWIRAEDPSAITSDLAGLGARVGVVGKNLPSDGRVSQSINTGAPASLGQATGTEATSSAKPLEVQAVLQWLMGARRWLLVFDDAADLRTLIDYLPEAGDGDLLITSRNPAWRGLAEPMKVDPLSSDEGVEFLRSRAGVAAVDDADAAAKLVEELGGLPLAIEQAASTVEQSGMSVRDYLDVILDTVDASSSQADRLLGSVDAVFRKSLDLLADNQAARDMMALCAWLSPAGIPRELIRDARDDMPDALRTTLALPVDLNELVGVLRRTSLLDVQRDMYSVHRLVQNAVRAGQDKAACADWVARALRAVTRQVPDDATDAKNWAKFERYLSTVMVVADHAHNFEKQLDKRDVELAARVLWYVGDYQYERHRFAEARVALEKKALPLAQSATGLKSQLVADIENSIGNVLDSLGDRAGARTRYDSARAINQELGPNGDLAIRLNNLGYLSENEGLLDDAFEKYNAALALNKKEGQDLEAAKTIVNLGSVAAARGEWDEAQSRYEEALRIDESNPSCSKGEAAVDLSALGDLLMDRQDYLGALGRFNKALEYGEAWYGKEDPAVAVNLTDVARAKIALRRAASAKPDLERAVEIQKAAYRGLKAGERGRTHYYLAKVFEAENKPDDALREYEQALDHHDSDTISKAEDLEAIASLLSNTNRDEAVTRLLHARRLYRNLRGMEEDVARVSAELQRLGVDRDDV